MDFYASSASFKGADQARPFVQGYVEALPDGTFSASVVITSEDTAVFEGTYAGTNTGVIRTPAGDMAPTGKQMALPFVTIFRWISDPAVNRGAVPSPLSVGVQIERMKVARSELERLYREQGSQLWRAVFLFVGDRETANDAVAEAFAQALRRGDGIRELQPWVWRAAFRIAAGYMKDRRRRMPPEEEAASEMPVDAADLSSALAALSPKQRAAAILYYHADYTTKEVARLIGSTPSAVGVHLFRARRKLRALLEVHDD